MVRGKSREALRRSCDVLVPDSRGRNVALAERVFGIVAAISEQTGGPESNSQGRDSQPVPESADAAALRRRDARTDGGARPPRGSQ